MTQNKKIKLTCKLLAALLILGQVSHFAYGQNTRIPVRKSANGKSYMNPKLVSPIEKEQLVHYSQLAAKLGTKQKINFYDFLDLITLGREPSRNIILLRGLIKQMSNLLKDSGAKQTSNISDYALENGRVDLQKHGNQIMSEKGLDDSRIKKLYFETAQSLLKDSDQGDPRNITSLHYETLLRVVEMAFNNSARAQTTKTVFIQAILNLNFKNAGNISQDSTSFYISIGIPRREYEKLDPLFTNRLPKLLYQVLEIKEGLVLKTPNNFDEVTFKYSHAMEITKIEGKIQNLIRKIILERNPTNSAGGGTPGGNP